MSRGFGAFGQFLGPNRPVPSRSSLVAVPWPTSRSLSIEEVFNKPMPLTVALEGPERQIIEAALKRNAWNRQATAAELDINRTTLYKKMRKYRLDVGEAN